MCYCEFPYCSVTFFPYIIWGERHHCRACGISVCNEHCTQNLTLSTRILKPFHGDAADIHTPIIATSLDGTTLPDVVTLKYVCLLCSDRALLVPSYVKGTKPTGTTWPQYIRFPTTFSAFSSFLIITLSYVYFVVSALEAEELLRKLNSVQEELYAKTADVTHLSAQMNSFTTQLHHMRSTIHSLEAQLNKSDDKDQRKLRRLKQQLKQLTATHAMATTSASTNGNAHHNASEDAANVTHPAISAAICLEMDHTDSLYSLSLDDTSTERSSLVSRTNSTSSVTSATSNSPLRRIDELYLLAQQQKTTLSEGTQTTPKVELKSHSQEQGGPFSPSEAPSPLVYQSNPSYLPHTNPPSTLNTSNQPIAPNTNAATVTMTHFPTSRLSPASFHSAQQNPPPLTSASSWIEYNDIYGVSSPQDDVGTDLYDPDYPDLPIVNGNIDSCDSYDNQDVRNDPDLLEVYGKKYSSVFGMLESDLTDELATVSSVSNSRVSPGNFMSGSFADTSKRVDGGGGSSSMVGAASFDDLNYSTKSL